MMQVSFAPAEIEAVVKPRETRGATTESVRGVSALATAAAGDLTFLGNAKYKAEVKTTRASVVLLPADYEGTPQENQLFLLVDKPSLALAKVCSRIEQSLWPGCAAASNNRYGPNQLPACIRRRVSPRRR